MSDQEWQSVGGWQCVKRIRQGEFYVYVFTDKSGDPIGSRFEEVARIDSRATPGKVPRGTWAMLRHAISTLLMWFEGEMVEPIEELEEEPEELEE